MIKTVIFDIGKVLIDYDWNDYFTKLFHRDAAFNARMWDAMFAHGVWEEVDRGVWSDEELQQGFIKEAPDLEAELRTAWARLGEVLEPSSFTKDWIRSLKARGYQVLFLSNWSWHLLAAGREAMDFLELMDGGVFSFEEKLLKPDRAIYACIAERYGLIPEECVFLDDKAENVEAAKAFGFAGIVVRDHAQAAEALETLLRRCGREALSGR